MEDFIHRAFEQAMPGFAFGGYRGHGQYSHSLRAYSVAMFKEKQTDIDHGGKVILPSSALERLTRMNVQTPMLFRLFAPSTNKSTHVGVLEFTADEGCILLPSWLMHHLALEEGTSISISSVQLPTATYSKFKPLTAEFLDITNPKAVLEQVLRFFACLTKGDVIAVYYNSKVYEMLVVECRPADAVSIIECDMQVDFEEPDGYGTSGPQTTGSSLPISSRFLTPDARARMHSSGETGLEDDVRDAVKPVVFPTIFEPGSCCIQQYDSALPLRRTQNDKLMVNVSSLPSKGFAAFSGGGQRLGGPKKSRKTDNVVLPDKPEQIDVYSLNERGIPNYDWRPGCITFRRMRPQANSVPSLGKSPEAEFSPFAGVGNVLKRPKQQDLRKIPPPTN